MFSTVPGFDKPNAARFCANVAYVSAKATESALLVKKPRGESFSREIAEDIMYQVALSTRETDSTEGPRCFEKEKRLWRRWEVVYLMLVMMLNFF